MKHYFNGILISEVVNLDTVNKAKYGYLGAQVYIDLPTKTM
ncbi:hypothetical protein [Algibacter pectinivorans]|nr:hypothetical protein [Algibacter pectinivorans]